MNNSPYYTQYRGVSINFLIYFLLLTTTITTVGAKFFGKIWSILFIDGIIEYFIQY